MQPHAFGSNKSLSWLVRVTGVLGVASILALTVGRVIVLIAMISVIGIPIAFLISAIPSLFLFSFLTLIMALALHVTSWTRLLFPAAIALGVMTFIPYWQNAVTEAKALSLIEDDRQGSGAPWSPEGTLALLSTPVKGELARPDVSCDSLCQMLLARGLASRVIVASVSVEADPAREAGTAFHLENGALCKSTWSGVIVPEFRLALARGSCLVKRPGIPVKDAKAILWKRRIRDDNTWQGFFNPFSLPVAATRLSLYRSGGARLDEVWRQTSVVYAKLAPVLMPAFIFQGMDRIDVGLVRDLKSAGAPSIQEETEFLQAHLQIDLSKRPAPPPSVFQLAALETIVRRAEIATQNGGTLGTQDKPIVCEFIDSFGGSNAEMSLTRAQLESFLNATIRNPRWDLWCSLQAFTATAYRTSPELGKSVTAALLDRMTHNTQQEGMLAAAFDAVPDAQFADLWPRLSEHITRNFSVAQYFIRNTRRAHLTEHPDASLLAILELQQKNGGSGVFSTTPRKDVLHSAMASLCEVGVAGRAAPDTLPALAALLQGKNFLPDQYIEIGERPDSIGVAHTLAALGAGRDFIRGLRLPAHIAQTMEAPIEAALRKPDCSFR